MDEIIPSVVDNNNSIDAPIGCSTVALNEPGNVSYLVRIKIKFQVMEYSIFSGNLRTYRRCVVGESQQLLYRLRSYHF